ncbi:MAG TPA: ATP-dependent DNA helicase [Candidatus Paceibacterota bacterium]|nr:ATP-dependent DNA helicase [Candidatus Paceibacterota bacterium]
MATTEAFEEAYQKLNKKQKEAVDTIYGPVMVVAGPGTGKTQMLALRIGNILQKSTGTKPDELLALTFTESAVAALRTRLASFIGGAAYRVRIHTFHGFAQSILELRPDLFPRIAEGAQLGEVRGMALMEELLDAGSYTKIRSPKNPHRSARDLLAFMSKLKQEHYAPEQYLAELTQALEAVLADPDRVHESGRYAGQEKGEYRIRRERLEKHIEVAHLFRAYQDALEKESLYDYEDLINEAVRGLESDEGFRAQVGERSQFVLADEHQDANPAQNRLLELISDFDGSPNLFIVGDEKQAIYRFQGASLTSFFSLKEKYPDMRVISLDENYRSRSQILAAAHDLIAPAPVPDAALRPELAAVRGAGGAVEEVVCDTPREEREAICAHIRELYAGGVPYDDIAILTKKNADVLALAESLRQAGIPEDHASAEISALSHPVVVLFIALIRALTDLSQDAALARAFFLPGLPMPLAERMRLLGTPRAGKPLVKVLEEQGTSELRAWVRHMKKLAEEMSATPVVAWLARLASESGFVAGVLTLAESEDAYEAYQGFMEEAALLAREKPSATALDLLARLALIEKHELRVRRARTKHAGVRLMTVHGAKGLEFPHVIIAHATDEKWLRGKSDEFSLLLEKEDDEHDVRRLLYVAITRARDGVLITRAEVTDEDSAQTPLRFVADMAAHVSAGASASAAPEAAPYEARTILEPGFLKERLLARGFSPTGFNNYVQSPWQYYFRTLLQLPDAPTLPMLFGTAVHAGLKAYADALKSGGGSVESAITAFHTELAHMPLVALDRQELAKKGEEALSAYLAQESVGMASVHESEFPLAVSLAVPGVGDVPLKGMLDRLDMKSDGTVAVIDYKTGKARSENDIKGLTKSSDGGYYRQLVFYKLLLDRDGRYTMSEAALHFVEPDEKGKCVTRAFTITDAEVAALEAELITAAQRIADGSAFTATCDPESCDYCDLVGFLLAD